ncbi:MAG: hypothetical protein R3B13_30990 [Polyangiaceae bacterium]
MRQGIVLGVALLALCGKAVAQEAKTADASKAGVRFEVSERGPRLPWQLTIENTGSTPVRLSADPRLLAFDVTVPGRKKLEHCRLPADLVPRRVDPRTFVILAPGEGVSHPFDPRLYCFAAGGQWRLVPGAIIEPRFGFAKRTKTTWKHGKRVEVDAKQSPPFVAHVLDDERVEIDDDTTEGIKELSGPSFALRSEYARWAKTRLEEDRPHVDKAPIQMKLNQGSDARAEINASLSLTLKNKTKHSERLYFRRELVSFEVMGPDGLVTCDAQPDLRSPDPQAFLSLRAGGSMTITSRLVELCPRGAFARPGLYLVHARLDANEDGNEFGIDAFTGRIVSAAPATVRIRTGDLPFLRKRAMRRVHAGGRPPPPPPPSPGH